MREEREGGRHARTHARTHARARAHTHTHTWRYQWPARRRHTRPRGRAGGGRPAAGAIAEGVASRPAALSLRFGPRPAVQAPSLSGFEARRPKRACSGLASRMCLPPPPCRRTRRDVGGCAKPAGRPGNRQTGRQAGRQTDRQTENTNRATRITTTSDTRKTHNVTRRYSSAGVGRRTKHGAAAG